MCLTVLGADEELAIIWIERDIKSRQNLIAAVREDMDFVEV